MSRRRIRIGLAAVAVVMVAIAAVVAFTGGDSTSASTADADAFQSCLADHGVEVPDGGMPGGAPPAGGPAPANATPPSGSDAPQIPSGGAAGAPDDETQQAFEDCSQYAPGGGPPATPPS